MSGRAPQKPPKDAHRIRLDSPKTGVAIAEWMNANGFPYYIPEDAELYLSRDGRTLYGERFLVRIGREGDHSRVRRWDYQLDETEMEMARKTFAYPIVRSLWDYAPKVAARIGLAPRISTVYVELVPHLPALRGKR